MKKDFKMKILSTKTLVFFMLLAIGLLAYSSSLNSSFQLDDSHNIIANPDVAIDELSLDALKGAAFSYNTDPRPVSHLSFAVNYYFSRLDTFSYHLINVIIHAVNAFLIYIIILTLFDFDRADDVKKGMLRTSAFFTALIWLVTPANSQTVIYIVQRMTQLMTLFYLSSFLFYVLARKRRRSAYYILCALFFALSLLSKENGVTLPLMIIMYEFVFTHKGDLKGLVKREKPALIAVSLLFMLILSLYKGQIENALNNGYAMRDFSMYERLLTQPRVLLFYISLLILPLPNRLSITHDIIKSTSLVSPVTTLFSFIALAAVVIIALRRIKRSPYFSFAVLWFFIAMLVESTVFPLIMVFEHRIYLPAIFLIGATIDFLINRYFVLFKIRLIAALLCVAILFAVLTGIRGKVWRNPLALWSDVVGKYPDDAFANNNLGTAYSERNDIMKARKYFLRAVELKDDWVLARYNLGDNYANTGDFDNALIHYNAGFELDPKSTGILFGLGDVYRSIGVYGEAEKYFKMAYAESRVREQLHWKSINNLGMVYLVTGRFKEAEDAFKKGLSDYPLFGLLHHNLADLYKEQGKCKAALDEYSTAMKYDYFSNTTHLSIVKCMLDIGEIKSAQRFYDDYEEIISRFCYRAFVRGMIAEYKKEFGAAERFYRSYIECESAKSYPDGVSYRREVEARIEKIANAR